MDLLKRASRVVAALALYPLGACVPDLDTDESTITQPRVIAVIAEPAEAKPGATVSYSALLVDNEGTHDGGILAWFYCLAQKPLAELGPIDRRCLSPDSGKLTRIGKGISVSAALPTNACALFGPNIPPPEEGQEPGRPVDPDDTGGYKQPVMLGVNVGQGDELVLYEQRIACDLSGVSAQTASEFRLRYHNNQNPGLRDVIVTRASGEDVRLRAGDTLEVERGEQLTLLARWEACPENDVCGDGVCGPDETRESCAEDCAVVKGCSGQERYVWFDAEERTLKVRRESISLAWYATGGTYGDERTGVEEDDTSLHSGNTWLAPDSPGNTPLWVVTRDARGGVGTFEISLTVQ